LTAACLVAIATRFTTGTTLVAYTAFAAVVATLALVRSLGASLFRAVATAFVMTAAFSLLARSSFFAAGARTFLTGAALGIASAVASGITAAAVLASTYLLLCALAIGFITALLGFMAAFAGRLSTSENIDILLDACLQHLTDALRGQGSTSNAIDFSWGLALAFLDDREGYFAIVTHYGTADELALERLILNESTKAGCFALVVEESAKHLLTIGSHSHIAPDAAPKATAFQGKNQCVGTIGSLSLINGELVANLLSINIEGILTFEHLTVWRHHTRFLNQFIVLSLYVALGNTANAEGS